MDGRFKAEREFKTWRDQAASAEICFAGRPTGTRPLEMLAVARALLPADIEPVWLQQVHSAVVVDGAEGGCAGRGDALVTRRRGLALVVKTADCVPVLLAAAGAEIAAVHAGWRGIARRVVAATLDRLASPRDEVTAWIGPLIGACCYEVGDEVVEEVAGAVAPDGRAELCRPGPRGRPHLDLRRAVEHQLGEHGVGRIRHVEHCTSCDPGLWSYRRDGRGSGRNLALIWVRRIG